MTTVQEQIQKLNRGEHVVTYQFVQVPPRVPVVGELRFVFPLLPSPWEPLASMIHGNPVAILWTGEEWVTS